MELSPGVLQMRNLKICSQGYKLLTNLELESSPPHLSYVVLSSHAGSQSPDSIGEQQPQGFTHSDHMTS